MKIKPTDLNQEFEENSEFEENTEVETPPGITTTTELSEQTAVEITEFTTQGGSPAISFVSPISGLIIEMLKPTVSISLEIERYMTKKHKDAGVLQQLLINFHFLICRYGEKKGQRCMSLIALERIEDINEIHAINQICNEFFRIGQI